ncbi:hypothetical protein TRIUR3_25850 [Triticum urartu]|uniref:Uncharacterized protein n=1 Tax=Triticum urartu TaxID=4572 RepID=M7YGM9_TRIUA|nr:hypothetical protein TRIUR3_25850 [Triticum urartu]
MAASMPPPRVFPAGAELGLLAFLECGGDAREGEGKGGNDLILNGRIPSKCSQARFAKVEQCLPI